MGRPKPPQDHDQLPYAGSASSRSSSNSESREARSKKAHGAIGDPSLFVIWSRLTRASASPSCSASLCHPLGYPMCAASQSVQFAIAIRVGYFKAPGGVDGHF